MVLHREMNALSKNVYMLVVYRENTCIKKFQSWHFTFFRTFSRCHVHNFAHSSFQNHPFIKKQVPNESWHNPLSGNAHMYRENTEGYPTESHPCVSPQPTAIPNPNFWP